jgi:hypothetical protein
MLQTKKALARACGHIARVKKVSCSGMGETSTGRRRKDCLLYKRG